MIDVFEIVRDRAAKARAERIATSDDVSLGKEMALIATLMTMQSQAKAFGLDLDRLRMANFDPTVDELDPGRSG